MCDTFVSFRCNLLDCCYSLWHNSFHIMKKLFLSMLFVGSCAFTNAQEVSAEPSFTAIAGYADEINIRGLSYGGDGFLAGINGKFPVSLFDQDLTINAGAYNLLASEEDTQSHFHIGVGKGLEVAGLGLKASGGISSHQIADAAIDSSVAVKGTVELTSDPLSITDWVTPSVSLWKDVDYGFTGVTWGLKRDLELGLLNKDWTITPSVGWGIGDEYDYTQLSVGVSTDLELLGTVWEPNVNITYLDNDVDVDGLKADEQVSVWFGLKYNF